MKETDLKIRLDKCFHSCISKICKSYGSSAVPMVWYYIVVQNQIVFDIYADNHSLAKKAANKIAGQINKKFGLKINHSYFLNDTWSPVCTKNRIKFFENEMFICESAFDRPESQILHDTLLAAYFNVAREELAAKQYIFPADLSWNEYRKLYFDTTKSYPELNILIHSDNIKIEKEKTYI